MGPQSEAFDPDSPPRYSVWVHARDCECGYPRGQVSEGCRVDVYPLTPPEAGGFGPAVGYIKPLPQPDTIPAAELAGECCGYYCLGCPFMDEDEDVRSITDREEHNEGVPGE